MHWESKSWLVSTLAKLLSLGAHVTLLERVRACSNMNTFM
jgi:hypothetical protein